MKTNKKKKEKIKTKKITWKEWDAWMKKQKAKFEENQEKWKQIENSLNQEEK